MLNLIVIGLALRSNPFFVETCRTKSHRNMVVRCPTCYPATRHRSKMEGASLRNMGYVFREICISAEVDVSEVRAREIEYLFMMMTIVYGQ